MLQLYGFINYNKCTVLTQDVNNKGNCVEYMGFTAVLSIFCKSKTVMGSSLAVNWLGLCSLLTAQDPSQVRS